MFEELKAFRLVEPQRTFEFLDKAEDVAWQIYPQAVQFLINNGYIVEAASK